MKIFGFAIERVSKLQELYHRQSLMYQQRLERKQMEIDDLLEQRAKAANRMVRLEYDNVRLASTLFRLKQYKDSL